MSIERVKYPTTVGEPPEIIEEIVHTLDRVVEQNKVVRKRLIQRRELIELLTEVIEKFEENFARNPFGYSPAEVNVMTKAVKYLTVLHQESEQSNS